MVPLSPLFAAYLYIVPTVLQKSTQTRCLPQLPLTVWSITTLTFAISISISYERYYQKCVPTLNNTLSNYQNVLSRVNN